MLQGIPHHVTILKDREDKRFVSYSNLSSVVAYRKILPVEAQSFFALHIIFCLNANSVSGFSLVTYKQ